GHERAGQPPRRAHARALSGATAPSGPASHPASVGWLAAFWWLGALPNEDAPDAGPRGVAVERPVEPLLGARPHVLHGHLHLPDPLVRPVVERDHDLHAPRLVALVDDDAPD